MFLGWQPTRSCSAARPLLRWGCVMRRGLRVAPHGAIVIGSFDEANSAKPRRVDFKRPRREDLETKLSKDELELVTGGLDPAILYHSKFPATKRDKDFISHQISGIAEKKRQQLEDTEFVAARYLEDPEIMKSLFDTDGENLPSVLDETFPAMMPEDDRPSSTDETSSSDKTTSSTEPSGPVGRKYPFAHSDEKDGGVELSAIPTVTSSPVDENLEQLDTELDHQMKSIFWQMNYGSADPSVPKSNIPCPGCGAALHCSDPGFPGYLPKELFVGRSDPTLRSTLCQRCYFLKEHSVALHSNVKPENYAKIISPIRKSRALLILVLDLMDFPASFSPAILNIVGLRRPLIIVGNKVDLIPRDSVGYLARIRRTLSFSLMLSGVFPEVIKHVELISAKTGFGIESLITAIFRVWDGETDLYILGCTNSGKSTLYNAFLQSDLCRVRETDLLHRATVSPWPGTTLNLLKFPMFRPSSYLIRHRLARLRRLEDAIVEKMELKMRESSKYRREHPTLLGHVGRTEWSSNDIESCSPVPEPISRRRRWEKQEERNKPRLDDPFTVHEGTQQQPPSEDIHQLKGIDPNSIEFQLCKWCYDTPGTVNKQQLLNLLTVEELMALLPKKTLRPQVFRCMAGHTFFVGGVARIDILEENDQGILRMVLFASPALPVIMTRTEDAEGFYARSLTPAMAQKLLVVPSGDEQRLQDWPPLEGKEIEINGVGEMECSADVVLSSAGE